MPTPLDIRVERIELIVKEVKKRYPHIITKPNIVALPQRLLDVARELFGDIRNDTLRSYRDSAKRRIDEEIANYQKEHPKTIPVPDEPLLEQPPTVEELERKERKPKEEQP